MVYIIILNWKGANDTISCLETVTNLTKVPFRIIVCDNASPDNSYQEIRDWLINQIRNNPKLGGYELIELTRDGAEKKSTSPEGKFVYLVQTGANLGYAGGNNVGIRLALRQQDMKYVWLLNNDTEVEPDSLYHLVQRCEQDSTIGICGSRLIYHHDRKKLQGLGGIYSPWFCQTKAYAAFGDSSIAVNEAEVESKIDYVIGASMLIKRAVLEEVGLLEESYFLYYEELDLAYRAKSKFRIGLSSNSIVYHKEGASIGSGKSVLSDYYSLRNRLLFTQKNNKPYMLTVWLGLFVSLLNRIRKKERNKAINVIKIIATPNKNPFHDKPPK